MKNEALNYRVASVVLLALAISPLAAQPARTEEHGRSPASRAEPTDPSVPPPTGSLSWSISNACGVVAAYVVCSECGRPVALDEVALSLKLSDTGSSMLELQAFLRERGLHAEGSRLSAADLFNLLRSHPETRAIAYVAPSHWVVVSGLDSDACAVFSYPSWDEMSCDEFNSIYQGVALLVADAPTRWQVDLMPTPALIAVPLACAAFVMLQGRRWRRSPVSAIKD